MSDTAQHSSPAPANGREQTTGRQQAAAKAKDAVQSVEETVRDTVGTLQEHGSELLTESKATFDTASSQVQKTIRANPTAATLGALGLGVLIGLSLRAK